MKKQGKKWMLVVLALLAVVTVTLPLVGCKNDTVAEQTGGNAEQPATPGTDDQGSGDPEQPVTYTVTFDTKGGSSIVEQTVESGQTATKPADPTLENNVFGGWYSDEDLTQEYDFTTSVTGSFTLYAKWVERIEVTADYVSSEIERLTGDGSYILVVTGKLNDLSAITAALSSNKSAKVNLDLSKVSGLTEIGRGAFSGCSGLTSISIPEDVKSIGDVAFSGCSGLTSIDLSKATGLTTIGREVFRGCSGLTSINIPEGVKSIGMSAFRGCSGLTSISIPEGVTSIGDDAFVGCSELTTVTMKATTPPELGYGVFNGTAGNLQILVPSGFVDTYKEKWSDYEGKIKAIPDQTS